MSDAAPLPRLGEVFFDVRGNSRSMRLSWYADTGVAVFSIWQAGMCTGTFRLPIGDLSRMIEILERGPSPQGRGRPPVSGARRGPDRGRGEYPADEDEIGLLDSPAEPAGQGGYPAPDYNAGYGRTGQHAQGGSDHAGSGTAGYPAADYGPAGYSDPGYDQASFGDASFSGASYSSDRRSGADYGAPGYQPADYGAGEPDGHGPTGNDYHPAGYGRRSYAEDDPAGRGGQAGDDYTRGSYSPGAPDYLTGEHSVTGYREGMSTDSGSDYLSGGYGSQPAFPAGGRQRDDSRFPPDPGGQPAGETDGIGYHEERFVPPYVQGSGDSYLNDNRAGATGYDSDPDDAGYLVDGRPVSSPEGYREAQWPGDAYSYGSEYRRR